MTNFSLNPVYFYRINQAKTSIVLSSPIFLCGGFSLFLIIDKYFFSFSIPIEFLLSILATAEVVPEPRNGSKTVSPSFVHDNMILLSSSIGFCVGCSPAHFSFLGVNGILHTFLVCFPFGFRESSIKFLV